MIMFIELLPITPCEGGVNLHIKATPKAAKNYCGKTYTEPDGTNVLKVYVTAAPENGKANDAIIKLLCESTKIAKSQMRIVRGLTDRRKTIFISGIPEEIIQTLLYKLH